MAKFRYRMQNILDVKIKLETQAKNDFAIAAAAVNEEEEKLRLLETRLQDQTEYLRELQQGNLDFLKIKEATQGIEAIKDMIEKQKLALKRARDVLEERRIALAEAMQEVKTHEKLKEKEFQQFLADEAARESKEIDELVSYKFGAGSGDKKG